MNQDDFHRFPSGSEDITVMLDCLHELIPRARKQSNTYRTCEANGIKVA